MKDIIFDDFQNSVNDSLLRHQSILDLMTKYSEANARVNRAIAKSVTNCGCTKIHAEKHHIAEDDLIEEPYINLNTHLEGILCDNCREVIEREMGNNLFYLTALCNALNISLYDLLLQESDKINTLGKFSFR